MTKNRLFLFVIILSYYYLTVVNTNFECQALHSKRHWKIPGQFKNQLITEKWTCHWKVDLMLGKQIYKVSSRLYFLQPFMQSEIKKFRAEEKTFLDNERKKRKNVITSFNSYCKILIFFHFQKFIMKFCLYFLRY